MSAPVHLDIHELSLRAGGLGGGRLLFAALNARVRCAECWVVLGPNGAGKSSLLAALAGVFPAAQGRVDIEGRSLALWSGAALADRRAWCPQFWSDPFPASVRDTASLARGRHAGWATLGRDADPEVDALLDRLELMELADVDVRTLSGGERQRVALATTLLQGAPLILLDEPASHLDLAHQHLLLALLRDHARKDGAVVASLHDLNLAWELASHAILLDGRGAAWAGSRDDVMTADRLGAAFGVDIEVVSSGSSRRFWHRARSVAGRAEGR